MMLEKLPSDILRKIQEYLTDTERLKFPIIDLIWIDILKFPYRYPIQKNDLINFLNWMIRRKKNLYKTVSKIIITNHINFINNPLFIAILEIILLFPNIQNIYLRQFRSNYLIFDSIPISVCQLLKHKFKYLDKIQNLSMNPEFLLHINPKIYINTLSLGFGYSSFYSSNWKKSYSSETSTYALRIFLKRLKESNGYIKNLKINVTFINYQKFNFLFDKNIYKIVENIHFLQESVVRLRTHLFLFYYKIKSFLYVFYSN
jgi:hypothetical protein